MKNENYSSVKMNGHAAVFYSTLLSKAIPGVLFLLLLLPAVKSFGQSQTYTANGTFTVPAGVTSVNVQCWGAGGGGSDVDNNTVGGGGGGGAYAGSNVTVVPGTSYSIVVGMGGSAGVSGTNTTFNTTTVVAAGGASAASSSPTGATGGAVSASVGTVRYGGGNGAAGIGSNAGGGGGGAGSTGKGNDAINAAGGAAKNINGGAGGAGRTGQGGNGTDGSAYGGGGGGAYTNKIKFRNGGAGANGLAIISWTCPAYSLLTTTASGPVCRGNASTVTITSSAVNLPIGIYTITYNLSAPNAATGLTASVTVSTAGTATFTTTALANSGVTTVTITSLSSGAGTATCTNALSSNNTAAVTVNNSSPAINTQPTNPAATCSGSGIQTITVAANGTGLTYSWRKAGVAVTNGGVISGQGTATLTLTNPVAVNTGSYDVVISGTCSPSVTSNAVTVSLVTATAITTAAAPVSQTVLINSIPTNLTLTAAGNSLSYQWYSNNTNCNTCGTSVGSGSGGQTNTYTPPSNTVGTKYYYCVVTGTCGTVRTLAVSVIVTNSNTWAGGGTSNWNTAGNWSFGIIPSNTNDVVIPAGNTPYPVLSASTIVNNLTINAGTVISIGLNTLTINGAVSGTGTITGSETSSLVIGGNAGTVRFTTGGTNNYLKNFTINTGASATLGTALNITGGASANNEGTLTVAGTGVLNTGGNLTIKSNSFGTARVAAGNTAGGYIIGDVTIERYIPKNAGKGWRLLASNTSGQTINAAWQEGITGSMLNPNPGFGIKITSSGASLAAVQSFGFDTQSLGKSIFKYNQSTDMLEYVPNTNSTQLNSQHGYFIFIRGDRSIGQFGAGVPTTSTVLRSKGTLYQGNQAAVSLLAGQYAMVRNPYASRLDVRQITRTGGVVAAFQVWDPKLTGAYGGGAFQTFIRNNLSGNYEVSPGGGSYGGNGSVQNYIESGAAFYVQATGSAGTVQVLESSKTSGSQVAAFRPSSPASGNSRLLYNIYANNPSSIDMVDGGFIDFNDAYSNSVDIFDVRKNQNFNENFAILRSNTELVVERRQAVASSDTVFFKMYNMRQTTYRIDIESNGFDTLLATAELQDQYTGITTPLSLSVLNSYTFAVNTDAASRASDRFKVLLRQAAVLPVTFTSIKATPVADKIAVEWKVAAQVNIDHYEMEKSINGSSFSKAGVIMPAINQVYNWLDEHAVSGANFYRVKAVDKNGYNNYSAITKISLARHGAVVVVFPKLIQNGIINIRLNSQSKDEYAVHLINSLGQIIFKKKIKFDADEVWHKIELPSTVVGGAYELVMSEQGVLVGSIQLIIDKH